MSTSSALVSKVTDDDDGSDNSTVLTGGSDEGVATAEEPYSHFVLYLWMAILVVLFSSVPAVAIVNSEISITRNVHVDIQAYCISFIFGYAYIRLNLHIISRDLLLKYSPTTRSMPKPIQQECAFLLVDALSFFMWAPFGMYFVYRVFVAGSRDAYIELTGPITYCGFGTYFMDRFMHLMNNYSTNRFIHHVGEAVYGVYSLEWAPYTNFGALLFAVVLETQGKATSYWILCARLTRRHAKIHGKMGSPTQGVDALFIRRNASDMARCCRVFEAHHYCIALIFPLIMSTAAYFFLKTTPPDDSAIRTPADFWWMISNFALVALYTFIDWPIYKYLSEQSREKYWVTTIFTEQQETASRAICSCKSKKA